MSEEEIQHIDVLLPAASVTLFTTNQNSQTVFESLREDWRFARVIPDVQQGDIDTAISYYESYESPDLIIIQCDKIDDNLTERLGALAGNCSENTAAVIIGPDNDVNLYRKLVNIGVSDYLVKPIQQEQFSNDIAATLIDKVGLSGSQIIAMLSSKGGVGTTILSEAMGWAISEKLNQKTFLMDAAGGWSTISIGMDFEPSTTLAGAIKAAVEQNEDSLGRMIHSAADRYFVLSSGGDVLMENMIDPDGYEVLLDYVMHRYPVIVVDLSCAPMEIRQRIIKRAHQINIVSIPTLASIRGARSLLQEIKDLRGGGDDHEVEVILNKKGEIKNEVPMAQIQEGLEREITVEIEYNATSFIEAESDGKKISEAKGGDKIIEELAIVANKVIKSKAAEGIPEGGSGKKSGGLGFLNKLSSK